MNNTTRFNTYLAALQQYIIREGSATVPAHHEEYVAGQLVQLGTWVGYLRQRYKNNKLPEDRINILNNVPGWSWGPLRPGPKPNTSRNAEIRNLSQDGQSLTQIADRFNLSRQRIHQIVKRTTKQPQ
jgi:DNA-binding NarL/FixJ family response regulator